MVGSIKTGPNCVYREVFWGGNCVVACSTNIANDLKVQPWPAALIAISYTIVENSNIPPPDRFPIDASLFV